MHQNEVQCVKEATLPVIELAQTIANEALELADFAGGKLCSVQIKQAYIEANKDPSLEVWPPLFDQIRKSMLIIRESLKRTTEEIRSCQL